MSTITINVSSLPFNSTLTIIDPAAFADLVTGLDQAWVLIASYLVFFMQAGFALVEAGAVQSKDIISILMKNFTDFAISTLCYWLFGGAFAHGSTPFIGASSQGQNGAGGNDIWWASGSTTLYTLELFSSMFCATAVTIVSGAVACRFSFHAYVVLSIVFASIIYPVTAGWVWGYGFLSQANGFQSIDYAGSGVVHLQGGVVALVACVMVGPRIGRFVKNAEGKIVPSSDFAGSSIVLTSLGTMILWFGWYGFNPGSTLGLSEQRYLAAATASVNTTLASCSALLAGLILTRLLDGHYNFWDVLNCILAGLVGITAPCATVPPGGAIGVGVLSALAYQFTYRLLLRLQIDDVVGAVSVHGTPGIVGVLCAGLFSRQDYVDLAYPPAGSLNYRVGRQFGVQLLQVACTIAWVGVSSYITLLCIQKTIGIRVDRDDEMTGLDFKYHSGYAYETQNARLQRAKIQIERERILSEKIHRQAHEKDQERESHQKNGSKKGRKTARGSAISTNNHNATNKDQHKNGTTGGMMSTGSREDESMINSSTDEMSAVFSSPGRRPASDPSTVPIPENPKNSLNEPYALPDLPPLPSINSQPTPPAGVSRSPPLLPRGGNSPRNSGVPLISGFRGSSDSSGIEREQKQSEYRGLIAPQVIEMEGNTNANQGTRANHI